MARPSRTGRRDGWRAPTSIEALRDQGVRGLPKLHTLQDFSGNLGGRIVRNKLWFFGGARYEGYDREVLDAFYPDGTPSCSTRRPTIRWQNSPIR